MKLFQKFFFKYLILPLLKPVLFVVYDKQYLKGRWFDKSLVGWWWAFRSLFAQKIFRLNKYPAPFPCILSSVVSNYRNIVFHVDDLNNFQSPGVYFQCFSAKIYIGRGSYIAPNVGLITANHDLQNLDDHFQGKDIVLGKHCWIGMNSVLLPGIRLGDNTVVGAGSVVTKSFDSGHCVIAGNPAKLIKYIS